MRRRHRSFTLVAAVLIATALPITAIAQSTPTKPRVPPGTDPGGIAIAIIGSGIDYPNPDIAKRLARDGEGEIVGWDFLDHDRRPAVRCDSPPEAICPMQLLTPLLTDPGRRLIVMRAEMTRPQSMVLAVQAIAQTDARIVLVASRTPPPLEFLTEAARRHADLIFVGAVAPRPQSEPAQIIRGDNYIALPLSTTLDAPHARTTTAAALLVSEIARCVTDSPRTAATKALLDCAQGTLGRTPQRK